MAVSADRLSAPASQVEVIEGALRRARLAERIRCANLAADYPLDGFAYAPEHNLGELLRLKDSISQAILKGLPCGERDT